MCQDNQTSLAKESHLYSLSKKDIEEINNKIHGITTEVCTIFWSNITIQKGIGVHPIAKKLQSKIRPLEDIKLKIKKEHQGEYLTANATGKIQWRAEYILLELHKLSKLLHRVGITQDTNQILDSMRFIQKYSVPIHLSAEDTNDHNQPS